MATCNNICLRKTGSFHTFSQSQHERPADAVRPAEHISTNQNLRLKLHMSRKFYEEERVRKGIMPFTTYAKLANCLHPDKPPPTLEQRQEAFGLLSQWKQSSGRTRRT